MKRRMMIEEIERDHGPLVAVVALVVLIVTLLLHRFGPEIVLSASSACAVAIGGIWAYLAFHRQGMDRPKARVSIQTSEIRMSDDSILIHAIMTVENIGLVRIDIRSFHVRFQMVLPVIDAGVIRDLREAEKGFDKFPRGFDFVPKHRSARDWPEICQRREADESETMIEPGETQQLYADVLVPPYVELVRVYGFFSARQKSKFVWACEKFHRVGSSEAKNDGFTANLPEQER